MKSKIISTWKRAGVLVHRIVGHIFRCRHDWSIIGTNGFGHPSEEICILCGAYRHRIHDRTKIGHEEWQEGKYPK